MPCKDCKHYKPPPGNGLGECRRMPPTPMGPNHAYWPVVEREDYCGLYELPKPAADKKPSLR